MSRSAKVPSAVAPSAVRLPPLDEFTTEGGMTVVIARREPIPLVAVRLLLRAGSASDPPARHGLAAFTGKLLRRGTSSMGADEINEAVEFVGAQLRVATHEDYLAVTLTTPSRHLAAMLEVISGLVREPAFAEFEVETARRRTLAQLANDLDDPGLVADRGLQKALWGDHPYGHDVAGTAAHIERIGREDLVAFHRERFGPKVAMLSIVGAVEPVLARRAVEASFGGWRGGPKAPVTVVPLQRAVGAGRVLLIDKPDQTQSQVRIGALAMVRGGPDWIPGQVMNNALGGGFTSRLVNEIRVKRGLSYGAGSAFDGMLTGGSFHVSTFTKTQSTSEIIAVALDELRKMSARGPTASELSTAQRHLAGLYPLRLETNESMAAALIETRMYGLGDDWIEKYRGRILEVSRARAAQVARRYLPAKAPALVVVGNAAKVRRQLRGLGPIDLKSIPDVG
jgi:zinc protease